MTRLPLYILVLALIALPGCNKRKRKVSEPPDGGGLDGFFSPASDSAVLRFDTWVVPADGAAIADVGVPVVDSPSGPLPDLAVSWLGAKASGDVVTYTVRVCNKGAAAATAFYVDVYFNRATAPPPKAYGQVFAQQPGLGQSKCVDVTLTRNNAPAGTFKSWARVDTDGAVAESDEGNNVSGPVSVKVEASLPDLVPYSMMAWKKGQTKITVFYRISVCNKGSGAAAATDVHLYYDRQTPPKAADSGDNSTTVPALKAGLCVTRELTRADTPNGLYTTWVRVDVKGVVAESDEDNNVGGPLIYPVWHKVPAKTCDDVCAFTITCSAFPSANATQCKTWCKGITIPKRDCLLKAASKNNCYAIKACNPPPPPPPPPPPRRRPRRPRSARTCAPTSRPTAKSPASTGPATTPVRL